MASALAALLGTKWQMVNEEMVFGYSYREDGHCGDGTPCFNVRVTNGTNEATYAAAALIPQLKVRSAVNGRPRTLDARPVLFLNGNPAVLLVDNEILSVVIVFERREELRPGEAILNDNRVNDV